MRVYQLLTILLIFSLPFFPKQFADDRIKYLIIFFSISLAPIFFRTLIDDIKRRFIPTLFFLVFLTTITITTIFSIDREQSVIQLILYLCYFIIFISSRVIFPSLRSKELLVACYLLLVTCLSFISFYNTLIRHYVNRENISFLWIYYGHNHLSALLVFAIPLTLYFLKTYWKNKRIRILLVVMCFLLLVSLLFTFSIGAMIMLGISIVTIWFVFNKTLSLDKNLLIVFFILAFLVMSSLYLFSIEKGIETFNLRKNPYNNVSARFVFWQKAFDNFRKRPLTGSGLDTFHIVSKQTRPFSRYAHNFFIQLLSDSGIFGFLTGILLVGTIFREAYNTIRTTIYKRKRFFYVSFCVGMLSSTLLAAIDVDWHLPTVFLFFWILAGLLRKDVN